MNAISTLRRPLESVDFATREPALASYERSDVCVVRAAGVIGEAMAALVLGQAFLEKFGGDNLCETRRNFEGYIRQGEGFLMNAGKEQCCNCAGRRRGVRLAP